MMSTEGTTQGNPLAITMYMYAVVLTALIHKLKTACLCVGQVWFADNATVPSSCMNLKSWWCKLSSCGPALGYYPNASKTYLVVKKEHKSSARNFLQEPA